MCKSLLMVLMGVCLIAFIPGSHCMIRFPYNFNLGQYSVVTPAGEWIKSVVARLTDTLTSKAAVLYAANTGVDISKARSMFANKTPEVLEYRHSSDGSSDSMYYFIKFMLGKKIFHAEIEDTYRTRYLTIHNMAGPMLPSDPISTFH